MVKKKEDISRLTYWSLPLTSISASFYEHTPLISGFGEACQPSQPPSLPVPLIIACGNAFCHLPSGFLSFVTLWYQRLAALSVYQICSLLIGGYLGGHLLGAAVSLELIVIICKLHNLEDVNRCWNASLYIFVPSTIDLNFSAWLSARKTTLASIALLSKIIFLVLSLPPLVPTQYTASAKIVNAKLIL